MNVLQEAAEYISSQEDLSEARAVMVCVIDKNGDYISYVKIPDEVEDVTDEELLTALSALWEDIKNVCENPDAQLLN